MVAGRNIGMIAGGAALLLAAFGAWNWSNNGQLKLWAEGIHAIDFRNAPVEVFSTACADPQLASAGVTSIPLKDGSYSLGQYQFEIVGDVKYGDVSGHTAGGGTDKAVFVGSCTSNGQTSQVLFVYGLENGAAARLATANLSNGGNNLVQSYDVRDGAIQIKQNQGNPPTLALLSYALLNGSLASLGQTGGAPTQQAAALPATEPAAASDESATTDEDKVGYQTFHDRLAPYGQWINHPRWGTVWRPTSVGANFKPYANGHWENTDAYGTVWVSDYAWGDVPFHYGRWGYDPSYGWLWVPGYVWSPAWVVWRAGNGDIGWLPMPPGDYDGEGAFRDSWATWYGYRDWYGSLLSEAVFYGMWSFVPADDIYAPVLGGVIIAPGLYGGFIGRTAGWTRFGISGGHLVNRSIDGARFHAAFGHAMPVGGRHDFAAHHGPVTSVAAGHHIAVGERLNGHGLSTHAGIHGGVSLHSGSGTFTHHSVATVHAHTYSHSATYTHTGSTFSRTGSSGTFSRTGGGSTFSRSPSAGGSSSYSHGSYGSSNAYQSRSGLGSNNAPMNRAQPMQHAAPTVQHAPAARSCTKPHC
jgi:hypothetical protein